MIITLPHHMRILLCKRSPAVVQVITIFYMKVINAILIALMLQNLLLEGSAYLAIAHAKVALGGVTFVLLALALKIGYWMGMSVNVMHSLDSMMI